MLLHWLIKSLRYSGPKQLTIMCDLNYITLIMLALHKIINCHKITNYIVYLEIFTVTFIL